MNRFLVILMILIAVCMDGAVMSKGHAVETIRAEGKRQGNYAHITIDDSVSRIVNHPAFKGVSRLILPRENDASSDNTPLRNVRSLMPYHNHVDPNTVVGALNHMIDEVNNGKTMFYNFYTEQQKREDPAKAHTGLFLYRGEPGAPFAIVCPGGGFLGEAAAQWSLTSWPRP